MTGSSATLGNRTYTPIPFLVYVDGEISVYVKGEDVTPTPGPTPDPDPNPGPKPDPNPDVEPDPEPTPDVPDVPDTPDVPNEPEAPETPSDPSVPQTSDSSLTGLLAGPLPAGPGCSVPAKIYPAQRGPENPQINHLNRRMPAGDVPCRHLPGEEDDPCAENG